MELLIMFSDLNKDAQKAVLKHDGISSPSEMNYDVVPLFILEESIGID